MENQDNSFWRSTTRSIPGRPSPKKDIPKVPTGSTTSFERYQKSVSDAWTLSEDELTKEYCILSDEQPKSSGRRLFKPNRTTETIGVHRHQNASTFSPSSSSSSSSSSNSATVKIITAINNNNSSCSAENNNPRDENENQQQKKVSETHSEKSIEYG